MPASPTMVSNALSGVSKNSNVRLRQTIVNRSARAAALNVAVASIVSNFNSGRIIVGDMSRLYGSLLLDDGT